MAISVWAWDDGYGDNKMYNGMNEILIPSQCTQYVRQMKEDMKEGEVNPLSHLGVEVEGDDNMYLVGEGALKQDTFLNWTGGSNKHKDKNFPIIAKACLGVLAGTRFFSVVEPLVMGLPVREEESEDRHKLLKDILIGRHIVKLHTADGNVITREVIVKELITKKQPFGTFCDLILNDKGQIADKELASSFTVIVDIGTRTLNIYTLDALHPIADLSDTFNQGVQTSYDLVNEYIFQTLGFKVPTGRIASVVQKGYIRNIDLTKAIERSRHYLANEVFKIVDTLLVNSWVYVDNLIITGGGAEVLKPFLEDRFPIQPKFCNRFSTVRGFWKYGIRHVIKTKPTPVTVAMPSGGAIMVGMKDK